MLSNNRPQRSVAHRRRILTSSLVAATLVSGASLLSAPANAATAATSHDDKAFAFSGTWYSAASTAKFGGSDRYSSTTGSTYTFRFTGVQARVYAAKAPHHGIMAVSVNGGAEKTADLYSSARAEQVLAFTTPLLTSGTHTIRIRVTGTKNAASTGRVVTADRIDVTPAPVATPTAATPTTAAPSISATGPAGTRLLWSTNFDAGKASYNPEVENSPANASFLTPAHAKTGKVMRTAIVKGSATGHKFSSRFHNAPGAKGKHLGIAPQNEVYLSYDMYIPSSVNMNYRGKLPGLGGLPDSQGGWYTSSGGTMRPDSFSARLHVRPSSEYAVGRPYFDTYLYAWHAGGVKYGANGYKYGIAVPYTTDASNKRRTGKEIVIPRNRWFTVTQRIKLNTPGVNNGVFEGWIDGVKGVSLHDVQWRKAGVNTTINQLVGSTFANTSGYPSGGWFDYDNFRLSAP